MTLAALSPNNCNFVIAAEGGALVWSAVSQARQAAQESVESAESATESAAASAASASVAEAAAGPNYPDTAAGLAATVDGEAFAVDNGDGTVTVWLNDEGVAVEQRTLATTAALAGDGGAAMVGLKQTFAGAVLRSLADWFSDEISVMDFIPLVERVKVRLRTSTADLSAAFQAATDAAASRGGARVRVPSGTYPNVQGVELKQGVTYVGDGQACTIIQMPAVPSAHMFKAAAASAFDGGGFHGIQLQGRQTIGSAAWNAIDFSDCTRLDEFSIDLCLIQNFNRGFNGSLGAGGLGNDRFPTIRSSRFMYNQIGAYTNEHAIISFCDFRFNDIGMSGRINDLHAVYNKYTYNRIGCIGDPYINNSDFTACVWYGNTEIGAVLDEKNSVVGGTFVGVNDTAARGGLGDVGLLIRNNNVTVTGGVRFGQGGASTSFADAAILIERLSTGQVQYATTVLGNYFQLYGAGMGIRSNLGAQAFSHSKISENQVVSVGKRFAKLETIIALSAEGNTVRLTSALPDGQGIFEWGNSATGAGNEIGSNIISAGSSFPTGHAVMGPAAGLSFTSNKFRLFTNPVSVTNGNLAKWSNNQGYVTENKGTATVPAGEILVSVTHGLARTPGVGDLMVTPTNNMGAATKYRVINPAPSTFQIAVDVAPGGSGATFAWQANIL